MGAIHDLSDRLCDVEDRLLEIVALVERNPVLTAYQWRELHKRLTHLTVQSAQLAQHSMAREEEVGEKRL